MATRRTGPEWFFDQLHVEEEDFDQLHVGEGERLLESVRISDQENALI